MSLGIHEPVRWPLVRAACRESIKAWGRGLVRPLRGLGPARVPRRLLFAPQDMKIADPGVAGEMADGLFVFADRHPPAMSGRSPFEIVPPSAAWSEELFGFGWIRDLRADGSDESRQLARRLLLAALRSPRRMLERGIGRRPPVVARRVAALLAHSPFLLEGADHDLYTRYIRRIGRDAALLHRALRTEVSARDRLASAIALASVALSTEGLEGRLRPAGRALGAELDRLVLGEDAALARNSGELLDLLLDLLPLRQLYESRSLPVPQNLTEAIVRGRAFLAAMRHGNGDLALFNGTGPTDLGALARVLAAEEASEKRAVAPGYVRLSAGPSLVIVETGAAPPLALSAGHHAGPLSFELSSGLHPIVVNAGSPPYPGAARDAARRTASHSTLELGGTSAGTPLSWDDLSRGGWAKASLVRRFGPVLFGGASRVDSDVHRDGDVESLTARHDGYEPAFGAIHTRRLRLSADGRELEGEDSLSFSGRSARRDATAVLRFHLHPAVQAAEGEGRSGITLELPGGERWHFGAAGPLPQLRPSLFFAVTEGRRQTKQIVVELPPAESGSERSLRWLFIRR